jgi:hypothetical protein
VEDAFDPAEGVSHVFGITDAEEQPARHDPCRGDARRSDSVSVGATFPESPTEMSICLSGPSEPL